MTLRHCLLLATLVFGAVALALASGCVSTGTPNGNGNGGNGESEPPPPTPDTTPPTVQVLTVDPTRLPVEGGTVTLTVIASDETKIDAVVFGVTRGGDTTDLLATASGGIYTATYVAPMNTSGADLTYTVTARATDAAGNQSNVLSATFVVSGVVTPPGTPPG